MWYGAAEYRIEVDGIVVRSMRNGVNESESGTDGTSGRE